jgi:hypothetical protein
MRQTTAGIAAAVLVAVACTACAGTPTPVVTVTATEAAAAPTTASANSLAATPPAPAEPTKAAAPAPVADTAIMVPNGVGKNYQAAQDLWRAAGLHVLPATDALGAHRLPIIDTNWVVLAQDLRAGSKVPDDSFITATVEKYTD